MAALLTMLWADDRAAVVSPELVLVVALLVVGLIAGLVSLRNGANASLGNIANTLSALQTPDSVPGYSVGTLSPSYVPIAQVGGVSFGSANTTFLASNEAANDPMFHFSYSDSSGNVTNGWLTATYLGGGQYLATGGALTVTAGADVGTYSLYSGGPGATLSPSGAFIYDNVFYYGSNPFLDGNGLLYTGGGLEINVWGNSPNNYSFYSWNGSGYNIDVNGSPSAVAEPASSNPTVNPAP